MCAWVTVDTAPSPPNPRKSLLSSSPARGTKGRRDPNARTGGDAVPAGHCRAFSGPHRPRCDLGDPCLCPGVGVGNTESRKERTDAPARPGPQSPVSRSHTKAGSAPELACGGDLSRTQEAPVLGGSLGQRDAYR